MKRILPGVVLSAVIAFAWTAQGNDQGAGFDACMDMFPGGSVPQTPSATVTDLCKTVDDQPIFAIRYDTARKIPVWTAHRLTPEQMAQIKANSGTMRRPKFSPDAGLPDDAQAVDSSYKNSLFSRGHIVPANDMSWNKTAYDATFHFSNVAPQKQTFNAGTWLGAEEAFRTFVADKNTPLWNVSGAYGTVEDDPATAAREGPTIGKEPNAPTVPKCYYKVIAAPQGEGRPYKVIALVYAWNDFQKRQAWVDAITTLDTVEQRSGVDFLPGLSVEREYDPAYWGVAMPQTPADCQ